MKGLSAGGGGDGGVGNQKGLSAAGINNLRDAPLVVVVVVVISVVSEICSTYKYDIRLLIFNLKF